MKEKKLKKHKEKISKYATTFINTYGEGSLGVIEKCRKSKCDDFGDNYEIFEAVEEMLKNKKDQSVESIVLDKFIELLKERKAGKFDDVFSYDDIYKIIRNTSTPAPRTPVSEGQQPIK